MSVAVFVMKPRGCAIASRMSKVLNATPVKNNSGDLIHQMQMAAMVGCKVTFSLKRLNFVCLRSCELQSKGSFRYESQRMEENCYCQTVHYRS